MSEELRETAKKAEAEVASMAERAAGAVSAFESAVRKEVASMFLTAPVEEAERLTRETDAARLKLLELAAKPILVASRDAQEDALAEVAFLREACTRQQKELASLRASTSALSAERADLEASTRALRAEVEDLERKLAKAEEKGESDHAWPRFENATAVRVLGVGPWGDVDVPVLKGDSVSTLAKVLAAKCFRGSR